MKATFFNTNIAHNKSMRSYILLFSAALMIALSACRKYVEIPAVGIRALKYTTDYQNLLNNTNAFEFSYSFPLLSSDDVAIDNTTYQNSFTTATASVQLVSTYNWLFTRYATDTETDGDWDRFYQQIMICNNITDGVMKSEGGTDATKQAIYAAAQVHRAYAYLNLVNLYAKPYQAATASTDLGVPLLTTADLFASLKRASITAVYDQILSDLSSALPYLPDLATYNTDPSKAAAYAILAEANLEMRNFTAAGDYANKALTLKSTLVDLNTYATSPSTYPKRLLDPETLLSKTIGGTSFNAVTLSSDLLTLLGTADLRYATSTGLNTLTSAYGRSYYRQVYTGQSYITCGPNVPEMMLIKAEAAARAGSAADAVTILNTLRVKRFKPADYVALTAATGADALKLVIDERRKELFGRGFRWFDQRRLNQDAAFVKTYTRTFKGVTYTLAPNSNRYTYAIANKYLLLNPEIEQNPQ